MVKFGEVLNKLPAEWQGDRLGSLVASIKKDYAALTPDEQAEFNQFIYYNQEMFDFSYLDEVDLSLFNGQTNASLKCSSIIYNEPTNVQRRRKEISPLVILGPKSGYPDSVISDKAFARFVGNSSGWKIVAHRMKWKHNGVLLTLEEANKIIPQFAPSTLSSIDKIRLDAIKRQNFPFSNF